jgi:hypothetical protein
MKEKQEIPPKSGTTKINESAFVLIYAIRSMLVVRKSNQSIIQEALEDYYQKTKSEHLSRLEKEDCKINPSV